MLLSDLIQGRKKFYNQSTFLGVLDKMDLVFAIDTSSRFSQTEIKKIKELVAASIKSYQITQQLAHIGLVSFGSIATLALPLRNGVQRRSVRTALASLSEIRGQTSLNGLAQMLEKTAFSSTYGARASAPKVVVIITDGKSGVADEAQFPIYAALLNRAGIKIVIIDIGGDAKTSPLSRVPENPTNYMPVSNVNQLPEIYGLLERRVAVITGKF